MKGHEEGSWMQARAICRSDGHEDQFDGQFLQGLVREIEIIIHSKGSSCMVL